MYSRVLGTARSTTVFGRRYPITRLNRFLSEDLVSEMSYRGGGGGGYGRRGRGPNRGGGRGRGGGGRGRSRGRGGGAAGAEGHGAPPPGLRGRGLGMWYASRSRAHKKTKERNERAVVTMSRETEQNISEILQDVRRHSDASQTGFTGVSDAAETGMTSSDSYTSGSTSGVTGSASSSQLQDFDDSLSASVWTGGEESCTGMETELSVTSKTSQTGMTGSASVSNMDFVDGRGGGDNESRGKGSGQLFFIDNEGEGRSTIEQKVRQEREEVDKLNQALKAELMEKEENNARYKKMMEFRCKLPSWQTREQVLRMVSENQVSVISGETGCGKTTQVPQFILDEALLEGRGSKCHVICTQPRRISAISVAQRVASERGEGLGKSVGFQIRLENTLPRPHGCITYCTTGILLRRLIGDPLLSDVSHVIMDEVHERSIQSDFLAIILRDLLLKRRDLKLILMSATLNAEMFSEYFGKAPMFTIPNVVFPVAEYFLEDIMKFTRFQPEQKLTRPRSFWSRYGEGRVAYEREQEVAQAKEAYLTSLEATKTYPAHVIEALRCYDDKEINLELVKALLRYICTSMGNGAILVFLPGWDTISKLNDMLKSDPVFRSSQKYLVIPLHSMMPTAFQQQVFDRPPEGVRKIVIATNIAETSITIDDVVFVVDCGKVKETTYDAANQLACLEAVWVSKAAARQRRGRAGRVQAGHCFHLFTKFQLGQLSEYQQPEMLRTPLEELVLQIKILKLGQAESFLQRAIEAPERKAVNNAIRCLKDLSALTGEEELTPLGYHLANLPVNPRIGKIILFAAMFSCLDPVLTIASSLGFKEPFVIPLSKQEEADEVKRRFAGNTRSDHIALLNAYKGWEEARNYGNGKKYCWDNFLSNNTLELLRNMKGQFTGLLYDTGFVPSSDPKHSSANVNSDNMKLVKAVLCAGLYPNVFKVDQTKPGRPPKLFTKFGKAKFHPKSVNSEETTFENKFMIYYTMVKSSAVFIHDCSMIPPYPLLFFGGDISVMEDEGQELITVDHWIKFQAPRRIAELVKELRHQMDAILKQKIANPSMELYSPHRRTLSPTSKLIEAIIDLITTEDYSPQAARLAAGKHLYTRRK